MKAQTAPSPITLKPRSISDFWRDVDNVMNQIRQRAYQLFEWRGRADGRDLEDWFKAEMELLKPVPVEIAEKNGVLHVRADLPGFTEQELQVNLEPAVLTLKGEHREETEKREEKTYHSERRTQRIFRRVALPVDVIPDKAMATLKQGVLQLSVPKASQEKKIEIRAA